MNTGMIRGLLAEIDHQLTGKPINVNCRRTAESQSDKIDNYLHAFQKFEYYLSDGGYSRIWVEPFDSAVWISDNSLPGIKEKWESASVQDLAEKLRTWLRLSREEVEETIRRAEPPRATNYSQHELGHLHIDTFRQLQDKYGKGNIVGEAWFIRVGVGSVSLVTPYSVKQADGTWKKEEFTTAL